MKTNLISFAVLVLGIFLLSISGCIKDMFKPTEKKWQIYGHYYMGDLADYVCFKPGTFWIYKNPATNEYDTVRCGFGEKYMDTFVSADYKVKVVKETFLTGFDFSRDGSEGDFSDFRYIHWTKPPVPFPYKVYFGKSKQGQWEGTIVSLFYPFDKSKNPVNYDPYLQNTILLNKDTSINLFGRIFDTVQIFENTSDATWYGMTSIYYWAKHYGIIYRKDIQSGEEWYLESEHILQ